MAVLQFDANLCDACPGADCLVKCQYLDYDRDGAHAEMMKIVAGEDSAVLRDCVTCYACEEYCPTGNHPFYLICERREEKGMYTAPRPITNQWINMTQMQGKPKVGEVADTAVSCCFLKELGDMACGELFEGLASATVFGPEFMCPAVHTHFARMSVVKERLPIVFDNFAKLGVAKVLCLHDECYATYTSIASAYGLVAPFEPVYYMDFLLDRLKELKPRIKPLGLKVAYQRSCSNRLIPDKHPVVREILALIGAELVDREYQDENALCCGGILRLVSGYRLENDVQHRNVEDMKRSGADYCVFNCPACQSTLAGKVAKTGLEPIHLIDLCKLAIGETAREVA